jgi:hypothetical protein
MRLEKLRKAKLNLEKKTIEVETYIKSVDDSRMRRIIRYRFIEDLSWQQVAAKMGGGNSEDGYRIAFNRFMEK